MLEADTMSMTSMSGPARTPRRRRAKWRKGVAQSPTGCALASVGAPLFKCLLIGAVLVASALPVVDAAGLGGHPNEQHTQPSSKETYEGIKLWMAQKEVIRAAGSPGDAVDGPEWPKKDVEALGSIRGDVAERQKVVWERWTDPEAPDSWRSRLPGQMTMATCASRQRRRAGFDRRAAQGAPGRSGFVWLGRFWQLVFRPGGATANSQG